MDGNLINIFKNNTQLIKLNPEYASILENSHINSNND